MRLNIKSCISYKELPVLQKKSLRGHQNEEKDITRVPMFGKSLPLDNDTSDSIWKVLCCNRWVCT